MPKVRGPLFSLTASGTLSRLITFENRSDGQRVRRLPSHIPPSTPLQLLITNNVASMANSWRSWTPTDRALWNARGPDFGLTGYTLYWREWFAQAVTPPAHPILP